MKLLKELGQHKLTMLFTILNLLLVLQANYVAIQARHTSEASLGLQIDTRSQENVSHAYDSLYDNPTSFEIITQLRAKEPLPNTPALMRVIDIFEEIGSNFCQGTAKARHIRIYLKNTLALICSSPDILNYFATKKNGTAILCAEFFPDSPFAATLNSKDINTCEFVDSARFPKIDNGKRFQY